MAPVDMSKGCSPAVELSVKIPQPQKKEETNSDRSSGLFGY
jgi:hypothetical protein